MAMLKQLEIITHLDLYVEKSLLNCVSIGFLSCITRENSFEFTLAVQERSLVQISKFIFSKNLVSSFR